VQGREVVTSIARTLKVHDSGDPYRQDVKPQIRLEGKWLLKAGVAPEDRVEVLNPRPGILVLRKLTAQE